MSSVYRPICLSHDPAIELDHIEWQSGNHGLDILENVLRGPTKRDQLGDHQHCELVGGRFSYPLIEVYCPPVVDKDKHPASGYHPNIGHWVDAGWLRLLLAAYEQPDPAGELAGAAAQASRCWPADRLRKLRVLLGWPP